MVNSALRWFFRATSIVNSASRLCCSWHASTAAIMELFTMSGRGLMGRQQQPTHLWHCDHLSDGAARSPSNCYRHFSADLDRRDHSGGSSRCVSHRAKPSRGGSEASM